MNREVNVDLAQYRSIGEWNPMVGDIIIKYGWLSRTKWFAVVNAVADEINEINIIREGTMRLLLTTQPDRVRDKGINIKISRIKNSFVGSYSIIQRDSSSQIIWYI